MGLIITILLGALVGYLAARLFGRQEGFLASTAIGVVGAVLGNLLSIALGQGEQSIITFSLGSLLWALAGSVLVVLVLNYVQYKKTGL